MRELLRLSLLLPALLLLPSIPWVAVAQDPGESREGLRLSQASPSIHGRQSVRILGPTGLVDRTRETLSGGKAFLPAVSAGREIVFGGSGEPESYSQLRQSVAPLMGGGYGVVWEVGSFPDRNVRMQWLRPDGSLLFPRDGEAVADLPLDEADAVIATHPTAGAYVAFRRSDAGTDGQIFVQSFDATGAPRWPGDGIAASEMLPDEAQGSPRLLPDPSGGVFVCFESFKFTGDHGLRCQFLDAAGNRQWTRLGKSVGATGWLVLPQMVRDGTGGLLVFWRNQREPLSAPVHPMLIQGQRFSADGRPLWGRRAKVIRTTRLAESNSHSFRFFQAVSDGHGGAILAFNDWTGSSTGGLDVMAQRVSRDGALLWGNGKVVTGANGHQQHDATIADGDGGVFVASFEDFSPTNGRLLLFRLGPDGKRLWPAQGLLVSPRRAPAVDYGLEGSFDGGVLRLIWTHQLSPASTELDVRLTGYTRNGKRLGDAEGISLTTAPFGQFSIGLVYSPKRKEILAIWDDLRSGTWDNLDVLGATLPDDVWIPKEGSPGPAPDSSEIRNPENWASTDASD